MYTIGQRVCLWQIEFTWGSRLIRVVREVMVTITEIKTGVPGEFSGRPSPGQSLRGIDGDGETYEKHWDSWPESQTNNFIGEWSLRDDGSYGDRLWRPREAVYLYNAVSRRKKEPRMVLVDLSGARIKPKGDVVYCAKHDEYWHEGDECFECRLAI